MKPKEMTLMFDSLQRPIVYTDTRAEIQNIIHLCKMKPGDDPENPEKGINLESYRGSPVNGNGEFEHGPELESKIMDQVSKYTTYNVLYAKCMVTGKKKDNMSLVIGLPSPEETFALIVENGEITSISMLND